MKKLLLLLITLLVAKYYFAQNTTTLFFENKVGDKRMVLFDSVYTNQFNEPFTINKFRYYISNIKIWYNNGTKIFQPKNFYHLVNEAFEETKKVNFNTKLSNITLIEFLIGVDSIKNVSGVQTGDLDPAKGMFWTWNTGYIFATFEGQSDSSKAPAHYFSYHVGGFKKGENALRKIKLIVPKKLNSSQKLVLQTNALAWFTGKSNIKIKEEAVCHQPCNFALRLANNYQSMFSIGYQ